MTDALAINMPRLSDSMEEGTLVRWLIRDGDSVNPGDELAEIESDKATAVYEAQAGGILTTAIREGDTVPVGALICWLGETPGAPAGTGDTAGPAGAADLAGAADVEAASGNGAGTAERRAGSRPKASPLARRMAASHGVDLERVRGTGPDGRITREDVELYLSATPPVEAPAAPSVEAPTVPSVEAPAAPSLEAPAVPSVEAPAVPSVEAPAGPPVAAPPSPGPAAAPPLGGRGEVVVQPLSRVQSLVARRMVESRHEAPNFEVRMRIDADPVASLHAQLKEQVPTGGPSVNDFIIKAAAVALREHPRANGAYHDDTWQLYGRVNVGIAVATNDGLIVPTIYDADQRSLGEIARTARELAARAREGRISPQELDGGTFTVSNLGMFGVDGFSAIITPPQAAILAVGAIVEEPVVRDGAVVPGRVLELALSCDHRILYGADAARLLGRIRDLLERPLSLLLA